MFTLEERHRQRIDQALRAIDMTNISRFNSPGVLNSTCECVVTSYQQSNVGRCSVSYPSDPSLVTANRTHWDMMYDELSHVCDNINVSVNVDITGPWGECCCQLFSTSNLVKHRQVIVSYTIQSALLLYTHG